ncbi:SusC/RagA family TonB-linked outer membrane protein [Mucilaginibacter boryungensis]|uniref:TonB-dependent receptor n=1 Tax=Mucilaginibacter boryungensis TaxID=768480 RepID=A0ABR9XGV6_9SPHI|nr:TonB-dependent receptor [Mucilaginibacter boryungensis]MBE9666435.1 TonB-dependent receptor [Mucilaginibacter boryungensis]
MRQFYQKLLRLLVLLVAITGMLKTTAYAQQGIPVTGTVIDNTNLPLISVSVTVKGKPGGVVTDANGKFSITVPNEQSVLQFSYVGYVGEQRTVGKTRQFNITMTADAKGLNEVVVVGYGTQKRKDITGAVTSVDPKRLENLPNTSYVQALEGAIPGLTVTQTAGGAEGNSNSIAIRGRRSISAQNDPLVILDGIPYNGSASDINPGDIASIDILKDASAAAIYGSRGANGVILITTKKGVTGPPVISYDGSYGVQKLGKLPQLMSPQEFYDFKNARYPGIMTASEQAVHDAGNYPDYFKMGTRTGNRNNQSVSVRGGGNNSKFFVSANYLDVQGVTVNDLFKRLSTRANIDVDVTKWLTYGTATTLNYDDRSGLNPTITGDGSIYSFNPLTTAYNADGTLTVYPWPEKTAWANPLSPTLANNSDHTYSLFTTNYAIVKLPVKGLQYRINTGIRYAARNNYTYYGRNSKRGLEALGELNKVDDLGTDYTIENIIDFNRTFGKHTIAFTGLYSYENNVATNNSLNGQGFPNDVLTFYQPDQALALKPSSSYSKRTLLSQMGRLNYSYSSKYLLTLTARRDGASPFGEDKKYSFFPSAAIGWNISNEDFMKNVRAVSNLKLRLSYGSNGNQAVGVYSTFAGLGSTPYINGVTTAAGYIPNKLGDNSLHWETTNSFNAGLDFGLLNGRINGSIDVYSSHTHDLLLSRSISTVSGVSRITQNIGKTANKGVDIGVNSTNIQTKDFSWSTNATFTLNRNKIVDLYGNAKDDTLNTWFIGQPVDNNFGYKYGGVWQTTDDLTKSPQPNTKAGFAKVVDVNGDGKITPSDRTLLPGLQPSFAYGLGNTFIYKSWAFYVFVSGVQGVTKDNGALVDNVNTEVEKNTYVKNYWTPTNPTNDYYANANQVTGYLPNIYGVHIFQNASYLRVRDLLLSYSLPKSIMNKIKFSRFKVYVEARNLFTVTPWKGFDPELSDQAGGIPLQKEVIFGINVSL